MSNKPKRPPSSKGKEAPFRQLSSSQIPKRPPTPSLSKGRKHAALKGSPTVPVSAEEWRNVNRAIEETVKLVLDKNMALDSLGPDYWELDEGLGVALVAEIKRAIKETCSLSDPKLQKQLKKMASDVTHKEFRFPCKGGGVWFRFKMTNLQKATQRVDDQGRDSPPKAEQAQESADDKTDVVVKTDEPA
ncbi:hypothetical protein F5Y06DRAFT_296750 [Hypoxylon sp. FL0890]|nr:hypothetical protein F5Y06DRAFT_296750 [Hypoxylon sp. FL0890]